MPPRLIQLCDYARPQGGSFIPTIRGVRDAAVRRGWATEVAFFESSRPCPWVSDLADVPVHFAPEAVHGSDRRLTRWLDELLGDGDEPVVLHSHFSGFDVASVLAARRRRRLVVVWHVHSVFPRDPVHGVRAAVKFGVLGRRVDAILCPADNIVENVRRRGAPRRRVHFMPSAIPVEAFPLALADARGAARSRLGLPAGATVLLHFGWHWHWKGGDIFLEVTKRLAESGMDGIIALERGGREEYAEYARKLGISDRLVILDPVDDVRDLHAAADVMVSPSREEGMAFGLIEALAIGTPVVATDIPGHAFLGRHMRACRITAHGVEAVAEGIEQTLARSPEQAGEERDQARSWIEANLSVGVIAEELLDRYEALLAGRP